MRRISIVFRPLVGWVALLSVLAAGICPANALHGASPAIARCQAAPPRCCCQAPTPRPACCCQDRSPRPSPAPAVPADAGKEVRSSPWLCCSAVDAPLPAPSAGAASFARSASLEGRLTGASWQSFFCIWRI